LRRNVEGIAAPETNIRVDSALRSRGFARNLVRRKLAVGETLEQEESAAGKPRRTLGIFILLRGWRNLGRRAKYARARCRCPKP
jgi:hypothetical protein